MNFASPINLMPPKRYPDLTEFISGSSSSSSSSSSSESGDSKAAAQPCCPAVTPQQFLTWLTDLGTLAIIGFCFALITFGCNVAHLVDEQNKATYDHDRLSFGLIG